MVIDGNDVEVVSPSRTTIAADGNSTAGATSGPKSITVSGGATLTGNASAAVAIGYTAGSSYITITGDGSTLVANGLTKIGYNEDSTGTLKIEDGAYFDANGVIWIGYAEDSTGYLLVDSGSSVDAADNVLLGYASGSTGYLTIDNGSEHRNLGGAVAGRFLHERRGQRRGDGVERVHAHRERVVYDRSLWRDDIGTVTIESGSSLTAGDYIVLAYEAGTSGTLTLTGDGTTGMLNGDLFVGYEGDGTFEVLDGAAVTANLDILVGYGYTGATATGLLKVDGVGSSLSVNDSTVYIGTYSAGDGDTVGGTLTISGGGTVNVGTEVNGSYEGTVTVAALNGSTGTLIIGGAYDENATDEGAAAFGTLDAATVAFGYGTGSLVFNITDTDAYTFAAGFTGSGEINVYNGTISLTGDYTDYDGDTNVYGGTLQVHNDSFLNTVISVSDGVTLAGTGTVSSVMLSSGSTIAPGDDGVGRLTVSGSDLTFVSGSTLTIYVDSDGSSNLFSVVSTSDGNTSTGGSVTIEDGATLSISGVTTSDGISGTFTTVENDFAYLNASVKYDEDDVYVALTRNDTSLSGAGLPARPMRNRLRTRWEVWMRTATSTRPCCSSMRTTSTALSRNFPATAMPGRPRP
ncbi:hypothetical protein [Breoghania sp.]|uniref:beta strand repeat-containing protein n=1 Tax=Breoghania sp. TaxID=2065378 RepID=UPI0026129DE4|nr:hypothetical protein [Breoghania sp.]MDJ0932719.1 hypothetical protein [Breoghania sp.]